MLDHMEGIYDRRNLTPEKKAYFYRARAWFWGSYPKADEYRQKALQIHNEILSEGKLEGFELIANLYIAGFYTWKLGATAEAEKYFAEAASVKWVDEDGVETVGSEYINSLIEEIREGAADDAVRFSTNDRLE